MTLKEVVDTAKWEGASADTSPALFFLRWRWSRKNTHRHMLISTSANHFLLKSDWLLRIATSYVQTFDLVPELAALVLGVVHDGWRWRRSKAVFLYLAPVPLFPGQHALPTLPLVQVVPGLGKVHVEATRVFLVRAGAQADAITCGKNKGFVFSLITSRSQRLRKVRGRGRGRKDC